MDDLQRMFGLRVKQLRSEQGYSQNEFADVAGLTQAYLSRVERGLANPQLKKINQIALSLNISLTELFQIDVIDSNSHSITTDEKMKILSECFHLLPKNAIESIFDVLSMQIKRHRA